MVIVEEGDEDREHDGEWEWRGTVLIMGVNTP